MEERKFKNRTERLEWLDAQRGWGPLTDEERAILDDAVRMVTNLDSKPRYIARTTNMEETMKPEYKMEERKFKNRREQMEDYARRMGWGPLTEEDKIALDDIVRMVTNLDSRPRYAAVSH